MSDQDQEDRTRRAMALLTAMSVKDWDSVKGLMAEETNLHRLVFTLSAIALRFCEAWAEHTDQTPEQALAIYATKVALYLEESE